VELNIDLDEESSNRRGGADCIIRCCIICTCNLITSQLLHKKDGSCSYKEEIKIGLKQKVKLFLYVP
jgi:hypothetical protein